MILLRLHDNADASEDVATRQPKAQDTRILNALKDVIRVVADDNRQSKEDSRHRDRRKRGNSQGQKYSRERQTPCEQDDLTSLRNVVVIIRELFD